MKRSRYEKCSELPASAEEVFAWHLRPGAFERLTPPWEQVRVLDPGCGVVEGSRVVLAMRIGPVWRKWIAEHRGIVEGWQFEDVQVRGPFAEWHHTHRMTSVGTDRCLLEDRIEFAPPGGAVAAVVLPFIRRKLERTFAYRHRVTAADLAAHRLTKGPPMKILVSGATGLVGGALVPLLTTGGHSVARMVRRSPAAGDILWNPASGAVDASALEGCDAVVHLAGENIAGGRWNAARKALIRESRTNGTRVLCESLTKLQRKPRVLICASATGYYGDRGAEMLDEQSAAGKGFLAEVCKEWEAAADAARAAGIRVVHLRFGIVLTPKGGALAKMLTPFKLGAGGVVGSGEQYWSWIALDDAIGAILHALMHESLAGPANAVSPTPATNREFTKTLGRVLRRPTVFPMPAFAARLALGEMADALLLASTRVLPRQLEATGYQFRFPELEGALRHLLGK